MTLAWRSLKRTASNGFGRQGIGRVFVFAIAEECELYDECEAYTAVYGANVLEIEYSDNDPAISGRACAKRGGKIAIVLRDRELSTPESAGYVFKMC